MKNSISRWWLLLVLLVAPSAFALTQTAGFDVTATLTSKCEIPSGPTAVSFTYTSFQTGVQPSTGGAFSVRCTSTLPYTLSLTNATGTALTTGTVLGLNYTLSLSGAGGTGAGLTAAAYTVNGSMAAGQSGTCATTASCTGSVTGTHYVTVTY